MLRVNLLPPYIFDKQKKVQLMAVYGVVLAAVVVLFVIWMLGVQSQLSAKQKDLADAQNLQTQYQATQTEVTNLTQQNADIQAKQTFIADARKYNDSWPTVYTAMASVTSPQIILSSLYVDPGNHKMLRFNGFSPNEMNLARWWMALRNARDMFDSVFISLPPHPYPPTETAGAGMAGARSGFPGMGFGGGRPPMMGGSMGGPPMMSGGPMGGRPGMMMGGMGGPMMGMSGGFGGGRPGMMGGFGGGGGGQNGSTGPTVLEGRNGLAFVAFAVLKDTLAPPAVAPSWPAGGGAGGGFAGGRMGMMMGGMGGPGMMGGMGGPPMMMSGGPMGGRPGMMMGGAAPGGAGGGAAAGVK